MFGFLIPSGLWALTAAAVPVLIHFFARQRSRIHPFSHVAFLQRIEGNQMRRLRWLQTLLLWIRTLALGMIALSLARPVTRSGWIRGGQASQILVFDRSASMNRGDLFERAKRRALEWAAMGNPEDEVVLLFCDSKAKDETFWRKPEGVYPSHVLAGCEPTWRRGDFGALVPLIQTLLSKATHPNRELYVISDFQATGFPVPLDTLGKVADPLQIYVLPLSAETENIGLIDGGIASRVLSPQMPIRVFARVRHGGMREVHGLRIRLFMNERLVAQQAIDLQPGETRRIEFQVVPGSGLIGGEFRLDEDAYPADDAWYFTGRIPEQITLLLVGTDSEDWRPFYLALSSLPEASGLFTIRSVTGSGWKERLAEADVVFLCNPPPLTQEEAASLRAFLAGGGGVALWPGPRLDLVGYTRLLFEPLAGLHLTLDDIRDPEGIWTLGRIDTGHPLLEGLFSTPPVRFPSLLVQKRLLFGGKGEPGGLYFKDGRPLSIEKRVGRGRLFCFATGIDPAWSDLVYFPLFAPLVYHTAVALATGEGGETGSSWVGEPLTVLFDSTQPLMDQAVVDPEGNRIRLIPEPGGTQIRLVYDETRLPGLYWFYSGSEKVAVRAVNLDPRESDLRPLPVERLASLFPNGTLHRIGDTEGLAPSVKKARWGRELGDLFLLVGLFLLLGEMVVSRYAERIGQSES